MSEKACNTPRKNKINFNGINESLENAIGTWIVICQRMFFERIVRLLKQQHNKMKKGKNEISYFVFSLVFGVLFYDSRAMSNIVIF